MHNFTLVVGGVCNKIREVKIVSDLPPSTKYTNELLEFIRKIESGLI